MVGNKDGTQEILNGKIIVTDFRGLDPEGFVHKNLTKEKIVNEIFLVSVDGKVFLNKSDESSDILCRIFSLLMQESISSLKSYEKMAKRKYWYIHNIEDVGFMKTGYDDKLKALARFLVPVEIERRKIERIYYE